MVVCRVTTKIPLTGVETLLRSFIGYNENTKDDEGSMGFDLSTHEEENEISNGRTRARTSSEGQNLTIRKPNIGSWGTSWSSTPRSEGGRSKTSQSGEYNGNLNKQAVLTQLHIKEALFEAETFSLKINDQNDFRQAMENIRDINMSHCNLREVPRELFLLPNLSSLNLAHNMLESLPDTFWLCDSLRRLELQGEDDHEGMEKIDGLGMHEPVRNCFRIFPPEPPESMASKNAQLPKLTYVDISSCGIQELSARIAGFPYLTTLKASNNDISFLPEDLAWLKRLCIVEMEKNPLLSLPQSLTERPGLELICGIPNEILPGLYLGDIKSAANTKALRCRNIRRIVSVIESGDAIVPSGVDTLVMDAKDNPAQDLGFSNCFFPFFARFCLLPKGNVPSPSLLGLVSPEDDVNSLRTETNASTHSTISPIPKTEVPISSMDANYVPSLWQLSGASIEKDQEFERKVVLPSQLTPSGINGYSAPNVELHVFNRNMELNQPTDIRIANCFSDNFMGSEPVLIHCRAGVSRSAAVVIAVVMLVRKIPLRSAFLHVKQQRGSISPNLGFYRQLAKFESTLVNTGILSRSHEDFQRTHGNGAQRLPSLSVQEFLRLCSSSITADLWKARYGSRDAQIKFGLSKPRTGSEREGVPEASATFGNVLETTRGKGNVPEATTTFGSALENTRPGKQISPQEPFVSTSQSPVLEGVNTADSQSTSLLDAVGLNPLDSYVNEEDIDKEAPDIDSAPFSVFTPQGDGKDTSSNFQITPEGKQGETPRHSISMSTAWLFGKEPNSAHKSKTNTSSVLLPPPISSTWWSELSKSRRRSSSGSSDRSANLEVQPTHISFFIWQSDESNKTNVAQMPMNATNRFMVNSAAQRLLRDNVSRRQLNESEAVRLFSVAVPFEGGTGYFGVRNPYIPYNTISLGGLNYDEDKPKKDNVQEKVNNASSIASQNVRKVTSLMNLDSLVSSENIENASRNARDTNENQQSGERADRLRMLLRPSLMYSTGSGDWSASSSGRMGSKRRNSFGI